MLEGMTKVLEVLANKVSRKATIVALAMILIYMIAATPNVTLAMSFIVPIASLAAFFTILQWILDILYGKKGKVQNKIKEEIEEETNKDNS